MHIIIIYCINLITNLFITVYGYLYGTRFGGQVNVLPRASIFGTVPNEPPVHSPLYTKKRIFMHSIGSPKFITNSKRKRLNFSFFKVISTDYCYRKMTHQYFMRSNF